MLIFILNLLMISFIGFSILHGVISWIGRSFDKAETKNQKYGAMIFGFHTGASLRKYILPKYLASALLFMWLRNTSLILLVVVSLIEYALRHY